MTYDIKMKLDAVARYEAGGIGVRKLAAEIGVPSTTLHDWIRKARGANGDSKGRAIAMGAMMDVTDAVRGDVGKRMISITVNGFEVRADGEGIAAIVAAMSL